MPLMAFSRSLIRDLSLEFVNDHVQHRFRADRSGFCTATLRACSEPAAIPATNMAALVAICEARFMADVIYSPQ